MRTVEVFTPDAAAAVFMCAPLVVVLAVLREAWRAAPPRRSFDPRPFDPLPLVRTILAVVVLMLVARGYLLVALPCWVAFVWGMRHPDWPESLWRRGSAALAVVRG